jgi:uncharacterized alpha-E superfamily protein
VQGAAAHVRNPAAMSVEAWQAIKRLEKKVDELEQAQKLYDECQIVSAIETLKNQYKMLNARMNKKNNGETDRE